MNPIKDIANFHLEKGLMLDAQPGFADAFNRMMFILLNMRGDDMTIRASVTPDGLFTFSSLGNAARLPQPFELDLSDPQKIAIRNAVVTTGYMISGDSYPVTRVVNFDAPAAISCADVPASADFVLWYLITQYESELASQNATNCKLSIDPDADDPDHLLFRKPLYMLRIVSVPNEEDEGEYRYIVVTDLRNSTLVRLS